MEWHIIPTGRVWVDPGGAFGLVPAPLWKKHLQPNDLGQVPMDLNSMLIRSEGKNILIDTGLGNKLSEKATKQWGLEWPEGTMLENIEKQGLSPDDIDIVIDTHLHTDHCGGNTIEEERNLLPTFPNAEYLIQRAEFSEARYPNERTRATYLPDNFLPLWELDKIRFLYGDSQITKDIRCVITRGHTKAHQSIIIQGEKQPIMFISDLASYAIQLSRTGWTTAYDIEPMETIATKKIWQKWGIENNALFIFQHDAYIRGGKLIENDKGKFTVESKIGGSLA